MKQTQLIMGMPVTINVVDPNVKNADLQRIFNYFKTIDQRFSTYKKDSEISMINDQKLKIKDVSSQMKLIFKLAKKTKSQTNGFFDIYYQGKIDPSGIVKGWAILKAAKLLDKMGFKNYYLDVGGDIQVGGKNANGQKWQVGIKNPFNPQQIIKVVQLTNQGIATSGTYIRGQHIYNPKAGKIADDIISLTVIGNNIYDADRFATAAFAMGYQGIEFIAKLKGFEGYLINKMGVATFTPGFEKYVAN